jgi:hypothetical protein
MAERDRGLPPSERIEFRVGINLGDVIVDAGDIFGDGVNIAARLEGLAAPGGICLSRAAYEQVRGRLEFEVRDLGEQRLRNLKEPCAGPSPSSAPETQGYPKRQSPSLRTILPPRQDTAARKGWRASQTGELCAGHPSPARQPRG